MWRFVLPENPGRSHQRTIDLSAAHHKSVRGHLEAIALLQRERCGCAAEKESVAAGGYCSKEDGAQHIAVFLIAGTMRMVTATTARSQRVLRRSRARENLRLPTPSYETFWPRFTSTSGHKRTALGLDYALRATADR